MTQRTYDLTTHIAAFARRLRRDGLPIGPDEISLGLRACETIGLADRAGVRAALRSIFASSPHDLDRFERRFDEYFGRRASLRDPRLPEPPRPPSDAQRHLAEWGPMAADVDDEQATAAYSPSDALMERDIASMDDAEMIEIERHVRRLTRRLAARLSRRERRAQRGSQLDLRRSIRAGLRHGGELVHLQRRRRTCRKSRIVMVVDVSGSMDLYQRFLTGLARAFVTALGAGRVEAFAFSTELMRLTSALQTQDGRRVRGAIERLASSPSGTRIGQSLQEYLGRYGDRLDRRTHVIVASDGWDVGDLDVLDRAMAELARRSAQVIWLNPLAGRPDFEPSAAGMATALPYVDVLAPGHSLAGLHVLERMLLGNKREAVGRHQVGRGGRTRT